MFLDALIGYGLDGVPGGRASELIRAMRESPVPVISLDVPSGLDSTTGEVRGESVEPVITLTLALPKAGLASPVSGEVWLGDLGIPREVFRGAGVEVPPFLFDGRYRIRLIRRRS
jgi:NAD(P)H-hydrate epimerase